MLFRSERPRGPNAETHDRILLISAADGTILASVNSTTRLNALAVSPDHRVVAVAGDDQDIVLLDADTLTERSRFRAHDAAITALRFHPTLPVLASGSMDYSLKLWDTTTREVQQTIYGLDGRPVMLSFSPNGRLLAVDGMEYAFRIYDVSDAAQ